MLRFPPSCSTEKSVSCGKIVWVNPPPHVLLNFFFSAVDSRSPLDTFSYSLASDSFPQKTSTPVGKSLMCYIVSHSLLSELKRPFSSDAPAAFQWIAVCEVLSKHVARFEAQLFPPPFQAHHGAPQKKRIPFSPSFEGPEGRFPNCTLSPNFLLSPTLPQAIRPPLPLFKRTTLLEVQASYRLISPTSSRMGISPDGGFLSERTLPPLLVYLLNPACSHFIYIITPTKFFCFATHSNPLKGAIAPSSPEKSPVHVPVIPSPPEIRSNSFLSPALFIQD